MDEYISREVLLAEIAADYGNWTVCNDTDESYRQGVKDNYNDTIRLINDIPAADVQPVKHGKWIEKKVCRMKWIPYADDDVNPDDVDIECMTEQKCSYCKRRTIKFTYHIELDYCPLCGARMGGDSE